VPTPPTCPGSERWEAFREGGLDPDTESALIAHLDNCARCRDHLDRLGATLEFAADMKPNLDSTPSPQDSELLRALSSLRVLPEPAPTGESSSTSQGAWEQPSEQSPEEAHTTGAVHTERLGGLADEAAPLPASKLEPLTPVERSFLAPSDDPQSLGQLGSYEILGLVGRGGMGIVFKALDPALKRIVAVKVLAPVLASDALARRRFTREAQAAAAVCHDNVVNIHAVEDAAVLPYLVMQFVSGQSLQEKLDRVGPLGVKEILRIGMQVASGLAAAHAQGLVHRDIKPSNILLENSVERVKITDFGLARTAGESSVTAVGALAGTPSYMSPEQARGDRIDHRTDLFSLGSVLYAMCTGRSPFRADNAMAVLRKVIHDEPRPIGARNRDIPEWLVGIVRKLMSKDPADRYQSATELSELLAQHLAGLQHPSRSSHDEPSPTPAELLPPPTPPRSWVRRRAALPAMATAAIAIATFVAWQILGVGTPRTVSSAAKAPSGAPSRPVRTDPKAAAAAVERARTMLAANDYEKTIAAADDAILLDPKNPAGYALRGAAFARTKEPKKAVTSFTRSLELDCNQPQVFLDRAWMYADLKDIDHMVADSTAAIKLAPKNPWTYHTRSWASRVKKNYQQSLVDITEAIRLSPLASFYRERGMTYLELREWDPAISDFDEAIRLDPAEHQALIHLGRAYRAKGELLKSRPFYDTAIRLNPVDSAYYLERGWAELEAKELDLAIADFNAALKLNPEEHRALASLGGIYRGKGDPHRAIAVLSEAIRLKPEAADAYRERGLCYNLISDWDRAIADFKMLRKLDPASPAALPCLTSSYRAKRDLQRSLAVGTEAVQHAPKDAWAYSERAATYLEMKDWDRAVADLDDAIRFNPTAPWSFHNRAQAYRGRREFERALEDHKQAIELDPKISNFYFQRGLTYHAMGQWDRAIADFGEAIRLTPSDPRYTAGRALSRFSKGDKEGALADYDTAIRIDPKNARFVAERARVRLAAEDHRLAIDDYTRAISLAPSDTELYLERGRAHVGLKDDKKALEDLNAAIRLGCNDADAYQMRAEVRARLGDARGAKEDEDRAKKLRSGRESTGPR
jgi:tetratricopeptide (TPR) repeat protein